MKRVLVLTMVAILLVPVAAVAGLNNEMKLKIVAGGTVDAIVGAVGFDNTAERHLVTNVVLHKGRAAASTTFTVTLAINGVPSTLGTITTDSNGKAVKSFTSTVPVQTAKTFTAAVRVSVAGPPVYTYATGVRTLKYKK